MRDQNLKTNHHKGQSGQAALSFIAEERILHWPREATQRFRTSGHSDKADSLFCPTGIAKQVLQTLLNRPCSKDFAQKDRMRCPSWNRQQGADSVESRFDPETLPKNKFTEFNLTTADKTVTLNTERVYLFG